MASSCAARTRLFAVRNVEFFSGKTTSSISIILHHINCNKRHITERKTWKKFLPSLGGKFFSGADVSNAIYMNGHLLVITQVCIQPLSRRNESEQGQPMIGIPAERWLLSHPIAAEQFALRSTGPTHAPPRRKLRSG